MIYLDFEKIIKGLGCKPGFLNKMAFVGVSGMINNGEIIKGAAYSLDSNGYGALIVTDKNFYAFKTAGMISSVSVTIPIEKISSFSVSGGLVRNFFISEGTNQHIYKNVSNFESIMSAIKASKLEYETDTLPLPKVQEEKDIVIELRKFKALLDEKLISQDDFDKKKATLLGAA